MAHRLCFFQGASLALLEQDEQRSRRRQGARGLFSAGCSVCGCMPYNPPLKAQLLVSIWASLTALGDWLFQHRLVDLDGLLLLKHGKIKLKVSAVFLVRKWNSEGTGF